MVEPLGISTLPTSSAKCWASQARQHRPQQMVVRILLVQQGFRLHLAGSSALGVRHISSTAHTITPLVTIVEVTVLPMAMAPTLLIMILLELSVVGFSLLDSYMICIFLGYLKLVGGSGPHEGNVFVNGRPVCDDGWDDNDARVVCRCPYLSKFTKIMTMFYDEESKEILSNRMMGYSTGQQIQQSRFGRVPTNFAMDNVACTGSEASLLDCAHITNHNCVESEGAGVICTDSV